MKTDHGMGIGRRVKAEILLIIFIIAGFVFWGTPLYATTVSLNTGAYQALGTEFRVDMVLDSVSGLYGTGVDLVYDPEYLDIVDSDGNPANGRQPKVTQGTLLNNNGSDVTFLRAALQDGMPGTLVLGLSRSGTVPGINAVTTQIVLSAYFKSKKNGTTSIGFNRQGLRNPTNGAISVAAWNGVTITITDLLPVLTVDCPSAEFNLVNVGTTGNRSCTVTNAGTADLVITSVALTGGDAALFGKAHNCPSTIHPSGSCSINLTFTPPSPGPKSTTLRIVSDILGTPTPKDIPVNGTGFTTLNVSVSPPATGTVTGAGIACPGDCAESYTTQGASVQLTASAATGYHFVNWSGDATGTTPQVTLDMATNKSATANFAILSHAFTLTVQTIGNGSGTVTSSPPGITCGSGGADCTEDYDPATPVTLSATFDPGSLFAGWSGGVCQGTAPCTFTMEANKSVTAEFRAAPKMEISSLLLNEDFSAGMPATWVVGGDWSSGAAGNPCSSSPGIGAPFATPWAILDTSCGLSTYYHALYTPVLDASDCADLRLRYSNQYRYDTSWPEAANARNLTSSDGGWFWNDVYTMNADDGYPTPNTKTEPEVDISDLAGEAEAEILFDILASDGYWGIDNVQVFCSAAAAVHFRSSVSGTSGAKSFVIANTGAADLVMSAPLSLSGTNATDFTVPSSNDHCSNKTVPPSGSCTFDIVFSPALKGKKVAVLTILSNDPDHPTTTLNLNGDAVSFAVTPPEGTYGAEIRIVGSGFGASKGTVTLTSADGSVSPVKPKVLEWAADGTTIRCSISKVMVPGAYHVTVQPKVPKGTPAMTEQYAFTVKPLQILWLGPYWGSVGDQVTLKGRFFGNKKGKVYFGPRAGKVISWTMDAYGISTVVVTVPKGLASGYYYDVKVIYSILSDTFSQYYFLYE